MFHDWRSRRPMVVISFYRSGAHIVFQNGAYFYERLFVPHIGVWGSCFLVGAFLLLPPRPPPSRLTSHRLTSHRLTSHRLTSHRLTSHRLTSHRLTSHRLTSHRLTSHRLTSHRLTSHRLTSDRLTSHRLTSHRMTSHRLTSHSLTSHRLTSLVSYSERFGPRVFSPNSSEGEWGSQFFQETGFVPSSFPGSG